MKKSNKETPENLFAVPAKTWNKWDNQSKNMFNYLYFQGTKNAAIVIHPKGADVTTLTWNLAFLAADELYLMNKNKTP